MKVIFLGAGLSHYYNQTLNRIHQLPDVEVVDVVDSKSTGHMGSEIFQTRKGVNFRIESLEGFLAHKYSDFRYRNFHGLAEFLEKEKPDIVLGGEIYLYMFLQDPKLHALYRRLNIKLIMRDIPFRMDTYEEAKHKIFSGEMDGSYVPIQIVFLRLEKLIRKFGLDKFYRIYGRRIMLKRLEMKRRLFTMIDAHIHYVEAGRDIYATYDVPKEKIFTAYNSPDTDTLFAIREKIEKEPRILPDNPHRLVHLSRLATWKRVDLLIEAVAKLTPEFPGIELLVIGTGQEENNLKTLAQKLDIKDKIKFLGGIYDQETLGKYLMSSSIYVLAGMGGLSINDAMTFGLPVICSVCDGTEKKLVYEGRNGLYFRENDLKDLTAKIKQLFSQPELTRHMGKESTEIIKNEINIHIVTKRFKEAFDYVLQQLT